MSKEIINAETKEEIKKAVARKGYINEALNNVKNRGEDVWGAKRHKFDTWTLEELEREGLAGKYFNKKHVLGEIEVEKEERLKTEDTEGKIAAVYAVKRTLRNTVANDPVYRATYDKFIRVLEKADEDHRDPKGFLQTLYKEMKFENRYSYVDSSFLFGDRGELIGKLQKKMRYDAYLKEVLGAKLYKLIYNHGDDWGISPFDRIDKKDPTYQYYTFDNVVKEYAPKEKTKQSEVAKQFKKDDIVKIKDDVYDRMIKDGRFGIKTVITQADRQAKETYRHEMSKISRRVWTETEKKHPKLRGNSLAAKVSEECHKDKEYSEVFEKWKNTGGKENKKPLNRFKIIKKAKGGKVIDIHTVDKDNNITLVNRINIDPGALEVVKKKEKKIINPKELEKGTEAFERVGGKKIPENIKDSQDILMGGYKEEVDKDGNVNLIPSGSNKDTMMFRALQYGNALNEKERTHHTNGALSAFTDLSDITGIDKNLLSMKGKLALSFAARGAGKANAHYEGDLKIINFTKKNGFGTLAHEWGHFLDNIVSNITSGKGERYLGAGGFGSEGDYDKSKYQSEDNMIVSHSEDDLKNGDMIRKFPFDMQYNIDKKTGKRTVTVLETVSSEGSKHKSEDTGKVFDLDKDLPDNFLSNGFHIYNNLSELDKSAGQAVMALHDIGQTLVEKMDLSNDYSPYWRRTREKFARSFEVYVAEKMKKKGRVNSYLSKKSDEYTHEVYPQGELRKELVEKFDNLFKILREQKILQKAFEFYFRKKEPKKYRLTFRSTK
jgi:hypothetical protein